jgi:hypothetical protein
MATGKGYVLLALSTMLISGAWAGGKKVSGLSLQSSPQPKAPCLSQPFHIWHKPDAFFKNLKQVKRKRTLLYRRGNDVVANFPDSTTIIVDFWQGLSGPSACSILPVFDPARVRLRAEWRNDSQTMPATGNFAIAGKTSPQSWCEDKCVVRWTYELTIDSQNVPLQNDLLLRIETDNGSRLAEYVGKLSADSQPQVFPSAP